MTAPFNTVYADGGPPITGDGLNTFIQFCESVDAARGFIGTEGMAMSLAGTVSPGDGGQGVFFWNPTGTAADDNGVSTIVPFGSVPGSGEWIRLPAASPVPHSLAVFSTTGTFFVPPGVVQVKLRLWGAGGGSGGADSTHGGGCGGAGGYCEDIVSVTPGASMPVVIGVGGTAGAIGGDGGDGGASVFAGAQANGGGHGGGNGTSGGANGTATGARIIIFGQAGGLAYPIATNHYVSPPGGAAFSAAAAEITNGGPGQQGAFPGGGASAGCSDGTTGHPGGSGANGLLILEW